MIKIKKIVALSVGLIMTASLFTGCSTDGLAVISALGKSQTITSMQTKTDISVKVSGSNMSAQEQQMMDKVLPTINGMKISVATKTNQNQERTSGKVQGDIDIQIPQMPNPISMNFWVNTDLTGDKPVINEMFKMPQLLTSQFPKELQGKDYMVMNIADMTGVQGAPQLDYKKLMTFSKEFQPKFLDFIGKYAKQFSPTTNYINHAGTQTFFQDNKKQSIDTYEIKLNDKSFKDLMHYTLNNLSQNTDAMSFVKDYMSSVMSLYGTTDAKTKSSQDEMNKAFANLTTQLPQGLASLDKTLDSIKDLKIIGDNGISIKYGINQDGYIVNESGKAEFVVDLPNIIKLAANATEASSPSNPTGVYTVDIGFNTDITNINGEVDIELPKVDSTNSFNYTDLIKASSTKVQTK